MDSSSNIPTFLAQQFPSIHILLAIETGSRAHGLATKNSDHDVKGFFSSKDKKIQRIKQTGIKHKLIQNEIDVDFYNINQAIEKLQEGDQNIQRWISSPIVYINQIPEIVEFIKQECPFPLDELRSRVMKDISNCKGNKQQSKKIINMIVDDVMILNIGFRQDYPQSYDFYDMLGFLEEQDDQFYMDRNCEGLIGLISEIRGYVEQLYFMKKNGKGTQLIVASEQMIQFSEQVISIMDRFENREIMNKDLIENQMKIE